MIKRYTTNEMEKIWSDEAKYQSWLLVELYSAEAYSKVNKKITKKDLDNLWKKSKVNIDKIYEIEREVKHDVIAFTRSISSLLGEEKKWVHYGLTSTDVVDTALGYRLRLSNELIEKELLNLKKILKSLAKEHMKTYQIGRTHGIHAEVSTFGYKMALWFDEMNRNISRFAAARREIEVGKISGAVGNYANIPTSIQDYVCKKLKIDSSKISTQTLQRDRHSNFINTIALIGSSLDKFSIELRHLQRTEVGEVEENFSKGQKGSSAMPHKKNPISAENISGLSRLLRGFVVTSFENIPLWHERDISHSSNERIILSDASTLIHYMLRRFSNLLKNLKVNKDKMISNIEMTNGVVFSQRVMLELINTHGFSREKAYDKVQPLALEAYNKKTDFKNLLLSNDVLSKKELDKIFDLKYYSQNVEKIFKRLNII